MLRGVVLDGETADGETAGGGAAAPRPVTWSSSAARRAATSGNHPAGPAGDEWRAGSPLENAVFATTEWPGGLVAAEPFDGAVPVAVIEHRAVVAAEHDQRVVGTFQPIERRGDLADRPVELHDAVAARAHAGGSLKAFVWHPRHVDVVRGEKQKEGFLRVSLDPSHALTDPGVGEVLIAESGPRAPREETDAADPVVNRVVMQVEAEQ